MRKEHAVTTVRTSATSHPLVGQTFNIAGRQARIFLDATRYTEPDNFFNRITGSAPLAVAVEVSQDVYHDGDDGFESDDGGFYHRICRVNVPFSSDVDGYAPGEFRDFSRDFNYTHSGNLGAFYLGIVVRIATMYLTEKTHLDTGIAWIVPEIKNLNFSAHDVANVVSARRVVEKLGARARGLDFDKMRVGTEKNPPARELVDTLESFADGTSAWLEMSTIKNSASYREMRSRANALAFGCPGSYLSFLRAKARSKNPGFLWRNPELYPMLNVSEKDARTILVGFDSAQRISLVLKERAGFEAVGDVLRFSDLYSGARAYLYLSFAVSFDSDRELDGLDGTISQRAREDTDEIFSRVLVDTTHIPRGWVSSWIKCATILDFFLSRAPEFYSQVHEFLAFLICESLPMRSEEDCHPLGDALEMVLLWLTACKQVDTKEAKPLDFFLLFASHAIQSIWGLSSFADYAQHVRALPAQQALSSVAVLLNKKACEIYCNEVAPIVDEESADSEQQYERSVLAQVVGVAKCYGHTIALSDIDVSEIRYSYDKSFSLFFGRFLAEKNWEMMCAVCSLVPRWYVQGCNAQEVERRCDTVVQEMSRNPGVPVLVAVNLLGL